MRTRKTTRTYKPNQRKLQRAELIEDRTAKRKALIDSIERINAMTLDKRANFDLLYARYALEVRTDDAGNKALYWLQSVSSKARAGELAGCRGQVRIGEYSYIVGDVITVLDTGQWPDNLRKIPEPYVPAQRTAWNKGLVKEAGKIQRHDAYNLFLAKHATGEPASQDDGADDATREGVFSSHS